MPKSSGFSGRRILFGQAIGFSLLIVIMWIVEFFHLPSLLFGEPREFIWTRVLARTATVLVIWLPVHLTTSRLLRRLHELEGFLVMCSWCRRVGDNDKWVSVEDYFGSKFKTETSHGICPECARKEFPVSRPPAVRVPPATSALFTPNDSPKDNVNQ